MDQSTSIESFLGTYPVDPKTVPSTIPIEEVKLLMDRENMFPKRIQYWISNIWVAQGGQLTELFGQLEGREQIGK